ncbi:diguanylate cyclase [Vibrio vulnificus]
MMTKRFARLPLRYKMTLPTWLLFTVIFISVGGAAIKVISLSHYEGLHGRIKILSQGVASTLQAALTFADAATAKEQLNILTFDPDIIAAQVKSTDLLTKAAIHRLPQDIAQRLEAYYEPKMAVDALMHSIVNGCKGKAVELRARDGERRYRVTCHPMSEGKETLVQFEDISEAYLAEQRRKLISLMFEQNQDAILVLSRTFSVETQNLTSLRWFGEVHRLEEIHGYDSLQFTQAELKVLMKSGGLIRAMEVKCQDGSLLPCQLKLRVLKSTSGRVEAFVVTLSDLSVERELKRLNYVANHDPLTGLANRSHAFQSLQTEHDQGKDQYLLFLDLDGFKAVNDQFGHAIGDDLLRVVAKRLKNSVFNRDLVARLAGDEFLIGIRDAHTYVPVVERILEQLQQPISIDGCLCDVTASIGVSHWAVKDGVSLEERIHHADEAMYVAKRLGKNQYCCLQDELTV